MGYGSASFCFRCFLDLLNLSLYNIEAVFQLDFIVLVGPILRRSNFELNIFICRILSLF